MPPTIESEDELARLLDEAEACSRDARQLPADSWFEHPVFRALRRDRAIAFLAIHDRHHLRIIGEIVEAGRPE